MGLAFQVKYLLRSTAIAILGVSLALELAFFQGSLAHGESPTALEPVTLQLKWQHQFQFAGYYAAKALGYYEQAGLDVSFLEAPTDGSDPVGPVLEQEAEFGVGDAHLIALRSQGKPVIALAAIYQHSPLIFLALESSKIDHIHDIVGKKVMLQAGADAALIAYLKQESIELSQLQLIAHNFELDSLIQGEVDVISAYATDEPFLLEKAGLKYVTFNPRSSGIDFYGDTLFTTENYIREHPQRVKAFREASLAGWHYALEHPQDVITLILNDYSERHSPEHLAFEAQQSRKLILPHLLDIGTMNPKRWQAIADTYQELGLLPGQFNLEGFLYQDYVARDDYWLQACILGTVLLLIGLIGLSVRFYQLQARLRQEIKERIDSEAKLEELADRYRALVDHAPFPVVISSWPEGRVLYVNFQALQKFELNPDTIQEQITHNYYVSQDDRARLETTLAQEAFIQNWQVKLQTKTGNAFWASLSLSKITFDHQLAIFAAIVDVSEQRQLQKRLARLAITDELTGLFNRRYFMQRGTAEFNRTIRYQTPLSLMMLDIDHFKKINDQHGHDAGDLVLENLSQLLQENLRQFDILGRLGGEEFAILLPNIDRSEALALGERLRQMIEQDHLTVNGEEIVVTVSIGVTSLTLETPNLKSLLKQADRALYQAKRDGRNRVVFLH